MSDAAPPTETWSRLSIDAKALVWEIMNGPHPEAYRAQGTAAEAEAIAARAVIAGDAPNGDACLWAAPDFATIAGGPRELRPDRCTARPRPSCSRPDGQRLAHFMPSGWWAQGGEACS